VDSRKDVYFLIIGEFLNDSASDASDTLFWVFLTFLPRIALTYGN
jgi:hypothetical protein